MTPYFLLLVLSVVPGACYWWWGRGLIQRRDDIALAELLVSLNRRTCALNACALLGFLIVIELWELGWSHAFFLVLPIGGVLTGGFSVRKALHEESWSLSGYLVFLGRLFLAFGGFWLVLLATPFLVGVAGDLRWGVATGLVILLFLWSYFYPHTVVRFLGARPMNAQDRGRLEPLFATVEENTVAPVPDLFVVPCPGGRFVNAIALPSSTRPRVLFSRPLLDLLEPDEVGAIYAHEVAHLEHLRGRRLRIRALTVNGLIAMGLLWPLLLRGTGSMLVVLLVLWFGTVTLPWWRRWQRGHESDTDVRACELCGDAELVIRALTRLHQLLLLPRRLPLDVEQASTHPSLARRIRAIREAAGLPGRDLDPEASGPLFLQGKKKGEGLLFEADQISWFEQLPSVPESVSVEALRRSASSSRTVAYGQLVELRLKPRGREGAVLMALDRELEKRTFDVAAADVAAVQQRLDIVDTKLGPPSTAAFSPQGWPRIVVIFVMVAAILPPVVGGVFVPAVFLMVRPLPVNLTATGVAGLVGSLICFLQASSHPLGPAFVAVTGGVLGLACLPLLVTGVRRARRRPGEAPTGAWPLAVTCFLVLAVQCAALVYLRTAETDGVLSRWSLFVEWTPSSLVLPLVAMVALSFFAKRPAFFYR